MHFKILFAFLIIIGGMSLQSVAQEKFSVQGIVKNEKGESIPHASVSIKSFSTTSSSDGTFIIKGIGSGSYSLLVTSVGHHQKSQLVTINGADVKDLTVILATTEEQLQTVEVTGRKNTGYKADYSFAATKVAIPVTEIPSSVSTITQELITDKQAVRFDDVARSTNVRVTNNGRSVVIRGFVSTTRLINGLRTLNENYRFPSITPVVESYEVVKGPSSAMFGNMSPGGVVNIVTKKPLTEKKQSISFSTGSFNTVRGDLDFTGKVTDDGSVLYRINVFGQNSDTWFTNMKDNALTVAPSVSFLPTKSTRINIDLNHTKLLTMENDGLFPFKGKPIDDTPIGFTVLQAGDGNKTTTTSLNFSVSQAITNNINLNVSYLKDFLSWDEKRHVANIYLGDAAWSAQDSAINVSYAEWESKMNSDNLTGYFTANFNTGKVSHKGLIGYDYNVSLFNWGTYRYNGSVGSINVYDPSKSTQGLDGSAYTLAVINYDRANKTRNFAHGVYFQDQLTIAERLQVLLGLRYETYTFRLAYQTPTENEVSQKAWLPKIGFTYNLPSNTHLYASYITGFEPVSSGSLLFGKVEGGAKLKPEYSHQIELGVKQELFNKGLLLTGAVYQIKKTNVTQLTNPTVVNANDRIWRQVGEVESKGFEIEFNGQINPSFSLSGAYNFNDAKISDDIDIKRIGQRQGLAPKHQGNIWAKYVLLNHTVFNGLGFGLGASFSSETPMLQTPNQSTVGYGVVDAALFYKLNRVTLNLNVNNIGNKRYYTGAVRETERYYPGAPRNLMIRVGYTL